MNGNPGFTAYGIWNGATNEVISFIQRYQQMQFGTRVPMFQTEYSRVYGIGGGQFSWFFERFRWFAQDLDVNGNQQPNWAANYNNTLSQRMYGAMAGIGNEIFIANQFSVSAEVTGSGLMDVAVERSKYELADKSTESKFSSGSVPLCSQCERGMSICGGIRTDGVQIRFGYQALTFSTIPRT